MVGHVHKNTVTRNPFLQYISCITSVTPTGKPTTALVTSPQFAKYKNTLIIMLDSFYTFTL